MDLGNLSSCHLPITEFNSCLDAESSNPGSQEYVSRRNCAKSPTEDGPGKSSIWGGVLPKLSTPYLLGSSDMAAMHQDAPEDPEVVDKK